jgi:hypothetical protein
MSAISRFKRFTTQREPAISVSFLAAVVLYGIDRAVGLTDSDAELLGMLLVPIVSGLLIRYRVWSPAGVTAQVEASAAEARRQGFDEGRALESALTRAEQTAATPRPRSTGSVAKPAAPTARTTARKPKA